VIRSEEDRGAVLLIDSRFATAKYRALFPEHWQHIRIVFRTGDIAGI
jgi:Rad3-related DNA helicase